MLCAAVLLLMLAVIWVARTEERIPTLRVVTQTDQNSPGELPTIFPGDHAVTEESIVVGGPWVSQQLGAITALASSDTASTLTFRFYGTDVRLITRIGPEAGRVYVVLDGGVVPDLDRDERGSFVRLRALQAEDASIVVASGLSHREHVITVSPGPQGELAISGVEIEARTPYPWAFWLLYTSIGALLFLALRRIATLLSFNLGMPPDFEEPSPAGQFRE
jgi:hypothetical protein